MNYIVNNDICDNIYISNSDVNGIGIFTNVDIQKNNIICDAIVDNELTYFGSKINHCENKKNVDLQKNENGDYYFVATDDIKRNDELLINYTSDNIPNFISKNIYGFKKC